MSRLRINGLVKAKNSIVSQLKSGIPTSDAPAFKQQVRAVLAQVESICNTHNTTPDALPTPSRNAYQMLKKIDLENLPLVDDTPSKRRTNKPTNKQTNQPANRLTNKPKIANAVRLSEDASLYLGVIAGNLNAENRATALAMMVENAAKIEAACAHQNGHPVDLAIRSKRAYQFFKFLSDPKMLDIHLSTLAKLQVIGQAPPCSAQLGLFQKLPILDFQFAVQNPLYSAKQDGPRLKITISEALIGAPDEVLEAIVCNILTRKKTPHYQRLIKGYLDETEAVEMLTAIEATTGISETSSIGDFYNLETGFNQINATYFNGNLARPNLTWGQRMTYRKYGHYDFLRDTIMISKSLDARDVPAYVVDFVLYHEMLHKRLGVEVRSGRRYAHTPEFRKLEKEFAQFDAAEAFLGKLSRKARRSK